MRKPSNRPFAVAFLAIPFLMLFIDVVDKPAIAAERSQDSALLARVKRLQRERDECERELVRHLRSTRATTGLATPIDVGGMDFKVLAYLETLRPTSIAAVKELVLWLPVKQEPTTRESIPPLALYPAGRALAACGLMAVPSIKDYLLKSTTWENANLAIVILGRIQGPEGARAYISKLFKKKSHLSEQTTKAVVQVLESKWGR